MALLRRCHFVIKKPNKTRGRMAPIRSETVVVIRLWRGNSKLDGEYSRVIEDVNRGRFYELAYSERRENVYLDESIPT